MLYEMNATIREIEQTPTGGMKIGEGSHTQCNFVLSIDIKIHHVKWIVL